MEKGKSLVYDKAYLFAIRIVKAFQFLQEDKRGFRLSNQLVRCGTSIGANIAEANGAISQNDFSAKMSTVYKECLETKYWLNLLKDTGYINIQIFESMIAQAEEISKMLFAILKTTRINKQP